MMEKEIRNYTNNISTESRKVQGQAVVFNRDSSDLGFKEVIMKGAIDEDTIKRSDIFCYLNHDESRGVLARSRYGEGSLKLELRDDGLYYEFEAPNTQLGDELLSYLKRGEITSSSFAFTIADGGDTWFFDDNKELRREIYKIDRLYDVSPVFTPAYNTTSCTTRKVEEMTQLQEMYDEMQKEFEKF